MSRPVAAAASAAAVAPSATGRIRSTRSAGDGSAGPATSAQSATSSQVAPPKSSTLPQGDELVALVLGLLPPPPDSLAVTALGARFIKASGGHKHRDCANGDTLSQWIAKYPQHFKLEGHFVMRAAAATAPAVTASAGSAAATAASPTPSPAAVGTGASAASSGHAAPADSAKLVSLVRSLLPANGKPIMNSMLNPAFRSATRCKFSEHPSSGGLSMRDWLLLHPLHFCVSTQNTDTMVSLLKPALGSQQAQKNAAAAATIGAPNQPAAASSAAPSHTVKHAGTVASAHSAAAAATPSRPPIPHSANAAPTAAPTIPNQASQKVPAATAYAQLAPIFQQQKKQQSASAANPSALQTSPPVQQANKTAAAAATKSIPQTSDAQPASVASSSVASANAPSPAKPAQVWKLPSQPVAPRDPVYPSPAPASASAPSYHRAPPPQHHNAYNRGRCSAAKAHPRLSRAIDEIAAAYQSAMHAAGKFPGPIEHVYEHIVAHEDFVAAAAEASCHPPPSAQSGPPRWTVAAFVQLCSRGDASNKAVLDLPAFLAELLDLLDSVSLLLECTAAAPVETLWDVAAEMPRLLNEKCQPVVMVDANTGKEFKRFNRFERYRWQFRTYADLRLGRVENHPLARLIFNVPADLKAVPRYTKAELMDFTAGWMPAGPTQKLFQSGKVSEEKLLAALRLDPSVRAKAKAVMPAAGAAPSAKEMLRQKQATFSHAHPLALVDPAGPRFAEGWSCMVCDALGVPGDEARFVCDQVHCNADAHKKCVSQCPLLLQQLSADERQQLERLYGPPSVPTPAQSSGVVSASPLDRYMCIHIGSKFHSSIGMLKRIRGMAYDFMVSCFLSLPAILPACTTLPLDLARCGTIEPNPGEAADADAAAAAVAAAVDPVPHIRSRSACLRSFSRISTRATCSRKWRPRPCAGAMSACRRCMHAWPSSCSPRTTSTENVARRCAICSCSWKKRMCRRPNRRNWRRLRQSWASRPTPV